MKYLVLLIYMVALYSCGTIKYASELRNKQNSIRLANEFLEKDSAEFYYKYCKNQRPMVETRFIETGKYEGLAINIVTYSYPQSAANENPMFVNYAVKVYINSQTGSVVTKLLGPDGIGKIYDMDLFQGFSKNILQLTGQ